MGRKVKNLTPVKEIDFENAFVKKARMMMQLQYGMDLFFVDEKWLWVKTEPFNNSELKTFFGFITPFTSQRPNEESTGFTPSEVIKMIEKLNKTEKLEKVFNIKTAIADINKTGFRVPTLKELCELNFSNSVKEISYLLDSRRFCVYYPGTAYSEHKHMQQRRDAYGNQSFRMVRIVVEGDFDE